MQKHAKARLCPKPTTLNTPPELEDRGQRGPFTCSYTRCLPERTGTCFQLLEAPTKLLGLACSCAPHQCTSRSVPSPSSKPSRTPSSITSPPRKTVSGTSTPELPTASPPPPGTAEPAHRGQSKGGRVVGWQGGRVAGWQAQPAACRQWVSVAWGGLLGQRRLALRQAPQEVEHEQGSALPKGLPLDAAHAGSGEAPRHSFAALA
jgi:hypothetical protein